MMSPLKPPVRYRPEYEVIDQDEEALVDRCVAYLRRTLERQLTHYGRPVRAVHTKGHAMVCGTLEVLPDLPQALRQGLFSREEQFEVVARLSTALPEWGPDVVSTARGLALKIRPQLSSHSAATGWEQDFLLVNAPAFFVANLKQLTELMRLLPYLVERFKGAKRTLSPWLQRLESLFEQHGYRSTGLIGAAGQPPTHPLSETYYSQVPVLFGPYMAKVCLAPVSPALLALRAHRLDLDAAEDVLRQAVSSILAQEDSEWELRVQLCRDLERMPIEDAAVVWPEEESPYLPVARMVLPAQESWSASSEAREQEVAFSPWHCLPEHRPLGSIMRARRKTYAWAAEARQQRSSCPFHAR